MKRYDLAQVHLFLWYQAWKGGDGRAKQTSRDTILFSGVNDLVCLGLSETLGLRNLTRFVSQITDYIHRLHEEHKEICGADLRLPWVDQPLAPNSTKHTYLIW